MTTPIQALCQAFALLENEQEASAFLKDLCTYEEIRSLAERWRVCQLLEAGHYSYRAIQEQTGVSLTTIGRVAHFLKHESHGGYARMLKKIRKRSLKKG